MSKEFVRPLNVSVSSLLNCVKNANVVVFAVVLYLCNIFAEAFIEADSTYPKLIVFLGYFIFAVLFHCHFAQIGKTVIQFVAVNMVKMFFWKRTSFNQPHQPMCGIFLPSKLNVSVSIRRNNASNGADLNPWALFSLKQQATCWNIIQHIKHKIFGYGVCVFMLKA